MEWHLICVSSLGIFSTRIPRISRQSNHWCPCEWLERNVGRLKKMTYMLVRKGQRFTIAIGGQWICLASRIISELDLDYSHQQFQHLRNQKNWRRFWNWRGWYFCAQKIMDMCQVFIHVLLRIVPCFGVLESFMDYFRTVLLLHLAAWFSSPLFCRCNF